MARSIDILTSDEKHLVVFAKGVTLDKSLPKYIRIKEKKESSSKAQFDSFKMSDLNTRPQTSEEARNERMKALSYDTIKKYFDDQMDGKNATITDFNLTLSETMRNIVEDTSYYNDGVVYGQSIVPIEYISLNNRSDEKVNLWAKIWKIIKNEFKQRGKQRQEKKRVAKFDVIKYFADIHMASEQSAKKYVNRITEYVNSIGIAEKTGQLALKERLFKDLIINKYESILYANGYDKLITEDTMVELTKKAPKAITLSYISNYTRIIPPEVIAKKAELDNLEIFDNYMILSYDPSGISYARTLEERRKEVEKAKDPILFGVIAGSNKLYYIDDWIDEYCDLRFENIVDIIGKDKMMKNYLKDKI